MGLGVLFSKIASSGMKEQLSQQIIITKSIISGFDAI